MAKSDIVARDMAAQFKARANVLWIVSREEARVERYVYEAAVAVKYDTLFWDAGQGVTDVNGARQQIGSVDAGETLQAIIERAKNGVRTVWVMRDLPGWLQGPIGMTTLRLLRNFARSDVPLDNAQHVVIVSPSGDVPAELTNHVTVIDWPLPDREEIAAVLDDLIDEYRLTDGMKNGKRDAAIDAAVGLSEEEAQACYSRSLVQFKTIDPVAVAKEKKRVIARERILEWYDPIPDGLAAVGGLENLKQWLIDRSVAYTPAARAYGLPRPRGTFLIGISGCGKTLTCKALATAWQCPLIRVDLGALKSEFVGKSEANLRKVFAIIEALGFCVVWFDEVEKSLQGATSGSADGGVSADALGAVLTWMQERRGDAFVVMTANDISQLPPEFMRKGRFDELWWIDLPNKTERRAVLKAALRENGRADVKIDLSLTDDSCVGFTGSEIAAIVPDALYAAFKDGAREVTTADLVAAASTVVPLSKTADKKIEEMRSKAAGRFRFASAKETIEQPQRKAGRALDIAS